MQTAIDNVRAHAADLANQEKQQQVEREEAIKRPEIIIKGGFQNRSSAMPTPRLQSHLRNNNSFEGRR